MLVGADFIALKLSDQGGDVHCGGVGGRGLRQRLFTLRAWVVRSSLGSLGVEPAMRKYFQLHAVLDVKHSEDWNEEALRPLIAERPECARAIAEGALMRLELGRRCFDEYRKRLWA